MIFMKRIVVAMLALTLLMPVAIADGDLSDSSTPHSSVTVAGETLHVTDDQVTLTMVYAGETGRYNGSVELWAPADAVLTCQGDALDASWNDSVATVDLGANGLSVAAGENLSVVARFPRDGDIVHRMLYDAPVSVIVDSRMWVRSSVPLSYTAGVYAGNATLGKDDTVTVLFAPGEDDGGNVLLYLALGLAGGGLAVGALMLVMGRQRRDRYLEKEPVEALRMRKKLLTGLLKQLEIERDKGKIADTYYQSIKDSFKEQAVEVMREIDRRV